MDPQFDMTFNMALYPNFYLDFDFLLIQVLN